MGQAEQLGLSGPDCAIRDRTLVAGVVGNVPSNGLQDQEDYGESEAWGLLRGGDGSSALPTHMARYRPADGRQALGIPPNAQDHEIK